MSDHENDKIRRLLRETFPSADSELRRDLWPQMASRLEPARAKVPWYDWALAAAVIAIAVLFPRLLMVLAYHL